MSKKICPPKASEALSITTRTNEIAKIALKSEAFRAILGALKST